MAAAERGSVDLHKRGWGLEHLESGLRKGLRTDLLETTVWREEDLADVFPPNKGIAAYLLYLRRDGEFGKLFAIEHTFSHGLNAVGKQHRYYSPIVYHPSFRSLLLRLWRDRELSGWKRTRRLRRKTGELLAYPLVLLNHAVVTA